MPVLVVLRPLGAGEGPGLSDRCGETLVLAGGVGGPAGSCSVRRPRLQGAAALEGLSEGVWVGGGPCSAAAGLCGAGRCLTRTRSWAPAAACPGAPAESPGWEPAFGCWSCAESRSKEEEEEEKDPHARPCFASAALQGLERVEQTLAGASLPSRPCGQDRTGQDRTWPLVSAWLVPAGRGCSGESHILRSAERLRLGSRGARGWLLGAGGWGTAQQTPGTAQASALPFLISTLCLHVSLSG